MANYRKPGVFVKTNVEGGGSSYPSSNHCATVIGQFYHVESKVSMGNSNYYIGLAMAGLSYPNLPDTNKGDAKLAVDVANADYAPVVSIRSEEGKDILLPDSVCTFTATSFEIEGNLRYNSDTGLYDPNSGDKELRGQIIISYRALSDKYSGSNERVLDFKSEADILAAFGPNGTSEANPIGYAASIALGEAQQLTKAICIGSPVDGKGEDVYKASPTLEDLRSWYAAALNVAEFDSDIGFIVMLTMEEFAKGLGKAHVEKMSAENGKSERRFICASSADIKELFYTGDGTFYAPVGSDATTKHVDISSQDSYALVDIQVPGNEAVDVLIGEAVRASNIVTYSGSVDHGLSVGDYAYVDSLGAASDSMDGLVRIDTVPTPQSLTYASEGADEASLTEGTIIKAAKVKDTTVETDEVAYNKATLNGATGLSWANTTLTVTLPGAHKATVGAEIKLDGFTNPIFNGVFKVATIIDGSGLTVEGADQGVGPITDVATGTFEIVTQHFYVDAALVALQKTDSARYKFFNVTKKSEVSGTLEFLDVVGTAGTKELTRQLKLVDSSISNFLAPGYQQFKKGNELSFADDTTYTVKRVTPDFVLLDYDGAAGAQYSNYSTIAAPYEQFYTMTRFKTIDGEEDSNVDKKALAESLRALGESINSERVVNIVPGWVYDTVAEKDVPAYYIACAVIGEAARKQAGTDIAVDGYTRFENPRTHTFFSRGFFDEDQLDIIASGGNLIFENTRNGEPLKSRHTLTTNMSSEEHQEFSLGIARDVTAKKFRDSIRGMIKKTRIGATGFNSELKMNLGSVIRFIESNEIMKSVKVDEVKTVEGSNTSLSLKISTYHIYPFNYANVDITARQPVAITITI